MGLDVNLTVRIPKVLKAEAEIAAKNMDVTLSQVVRRGLLDLCRDYRREQNRRSDDEDFRERQEYKRGLAESQGDPEVLKTLMTRQQRRAWDRDQKKVQK